MIKRILLSPWLALTTVALIIALRISDPVLLESTRLGYFDVLIANKTPTVNNIWTVDIDESAIERWGQWPFDRRIYSQIIQDLYQRGAGLVIFNVLMSEEDRQGGDQELSTTMTELPVILPNVPAEATKNQPKNPGAAILNPQYVNQILGYPGDHCQYT